MRWPKYWSFSFSISPSKEIPGLISFRIDWLDLLAVHEIDFYFSLWCLEVSSLYLSPTMKPYCCNFSWIKSSFQSLTSVWTLLLWHQPEHLTLQHISALTLLLRPLRTQNSRPTCSDFSVSTSSSASSPAFQWGLASHLTIISGLLVISLLVPSPHTHTHTHTLSFSIHSKPSKCRFDLIPLMEILQHLSTYSKIQPCVSFSKHFFLSPLFKKPNADSHSWAWCFPCQNYSFFSLCLSESM